MPGYLPPPTHDYLAKDYASFKRLILDRLAVTMPDWKNRDPEEVEVVLTELLAHAADYLSYYQDAVAMEAYLGTARKRISVRRHARLLDYPMHDGCNARCWISLEVSEDIRPTAVGEPVLPEGTMLLTRVPGMACILPKEKLEEAIRSKPLVFETMYALDELRASRSHIEFSTPGDDACWLPKGATQATLAESNTALGLKEGNVLILEEIISPQTGREKDADAARRHAVRLKTVRGTDPEGMTLIDPLSDKAITEISWHQEDALPFSLCLTQVGARDGHARTCSVARGNVVLADHGRSIDFRGMDLENTGVNQQERGLFPSEVKENSEFQPCLNYRGLTHCVKLDRNTMPDSSAHSMTRQGPRLAIPDIRLYVDNQTWTAKRDLLNSGPLDRDFVVETDEEGQAHVRFGDNKMGRLPEAGTGFCAEYRVGNGQSGNVGAERIVHLVWDRNEKIKVRNPMPASGGTDRESAEEVRLFAPHAFRRQERAVTEEDCARAAEAYTDVHKAVAVRRWTGSWYTICIGVVRHKEAAIDAEFKEGLLSHMEPYRLAGLDLEIEGAVFVPLDIAFTVIVKQGFLKADVKKTLEDTFSHKALPDGRRGIFHPDRTSFGQPVYLSRMVSAAMNVPGVGWVDFEESEKKPHHRFRRWGEKPGNGCRVGRIEMGRLEIARLENDPDHPEHGQLEVFLEDGP